MPDLDPIACSECGWMFLPKTEDTRTCSEGCSTQRARRLASGADPESVVTWRVVTAVDDVDPAENVVLISDPAEQVGTWTITIGPVEVD